MSSFMSDIGNYLSATSSVGLPGNLQTTKKDSTGLDMTDFLTLMITELTNQSIDETADTSDMLNQMIQMQMVQALTNMTDASIMSYAASLVGKEVTVAQYDGNGTLQETVGTVTGTGTYNGNQVVFVGDKYYQMSEILAVGTLPKDNASEEVTETSEVADVVEAAAASDAAEANEAANSVRAAEAEDTSEFPEVTEASEVSGETSEFEG